MTGGPAKILVPVDGSSQAEHAVTHAIEMVTLGQAAEIHLLNVQPPLTGGAVTFIDKPTRDAWLARKQCRMSPKPDEC